MAVAASRRLSLEYWGRHHPQLLLAPGKVPLDLFLAPILLAAEPARPATLAATPTAMGCWWSRSGMVRGMRRARKLL
jgi:hypothetical protein